MSLDDMLCLVPQDGLGEHRSFHADEMGSVVVVGAGSTVAVGAGIFEHVRKCGAVCDLDRAHGWDRYNQIHDDAERLCALEHETINMLGELGEFANQLKKCRRKKEYDEPPLKEEVVDMFIFLLKIARTMEIDLETEFYGKMKENEERFASMKK